MGFMNVLADIAYSFTQGKEVIKDVPENSYCYAIDNLVTFAEETTFDRTIQKYADDIVDIIKSAKNESVKNYGIKKLSELSRSNNITFDSTRMYISNRITDLLTGGD